MRKEVRYAFQKTSPVMLGFLFLGASYGIYMYKLGYNFLGSTSSSVDTQI